MAFNFTEKLDYTKKEAKHTKERMQNGLDRAFEAGEKAAQKTEEVAGPALDEAERVAGEMDGFMEHDPMMDDPADPVEPGLEEDQGFGIGQRRGEPEPLDMEDTPVEPAMGEDPILPDAGFEDGPEGDAEKGGPDWVGSASSDNRSPFL